MIAAIIMLAPAAADPLAGTWNGTSLCQVKVSACRNEKVRYRFTPERPSFYRIDAYKLVEGEEIFMGPIGARFDPATARLEGSLMSGGRPRGRLRLTLKGGYLSGTIRAPDGTLYRLIEAEKD